VHDGRLRFRAATVPPLDVVVEAGRSQPIPPDLDHEVVPEGGVRFSVAFLVPVPVPVPDPIPESGRGGPGGCGA
jgi:hypothetical protein